LRRGWRIATQTSAITSALTLRPLLNLARRAVDAGVSHFIYVSSLNVVPFDAPSARDPAHQYPEPKERYAASKWRAEQSLGQMFAGSHCQLTVLRPGLVYDVELTANLKTVKSVLRWWPWLLPSVGRRSMVARGDLVALLVSCALGESGAPTGEEILSATDGAVYDAERISRALSQGIKWGVMPQWLCRLRRQERLIGGGAMRLELTGAASARIIGPVTLLLSRAGSLL
jgi:nucleoside-diphosphate-sugar epimerase